jgi:phage gp46-like protein
MSDTTTVWNSAAGFGDWTLAGPVLQTGSDLQTAVLISLYTDRVAQLDDEIPDGSGDPRGWWGDAGQAVPIGSRIWLLERAKQVPVTLLRARDYAAEALQWLIDDKVVASFDIAAEWSRPGTLGMRVVAHKPNGESEAIDFSWTWNKVG